MSRYPLLRNFFYVFVALVLVVVFASGAAVGGLLGYLDSLPPLESLENYNPPEVSRVFDRTGNTQLAELFNAERREFVPITEIPLRARFRIGPFDLELITMTHSILEPNALAIRTGLGTVFHTGDWKLDPAPLIGTGEARLLALTLHDVTGARVEHVVSEEPLRIVARIQATRDLDRPHYGIGIRNRFGHSVFETNTYCMGETPPPLAAGATVRVEWHLIANLIRGDYSITVGVGNRPYGTGSFEEILFFAHDLAMLRVEVNPTAIRYDGYFNLQPTVAVTRG